MLGAEQEEAAPRGMWGPGATSPPLSPSGGGVAGTAQPPRTEPGAAGEFTKASWPSCLQAGTSGRGSGMGGAPQGRVGSRAIKKVDPGVRQTWIQVLALSLACDLGQVP